MSLIGVLITALGVLLALTIISHKGAPGPTQDWVVGLIDSQGPMTFAAVGILIACIPWRFCRW